MVVGDAVHDIHFRPRNTVDGPVQRVLASPEYVPVVETLPCLVQGNKTLKMNPESSNSSLFYQNIRYPFIGHYIYFSFTFLEIPFNIGDENFMHCNVISGIRLSLYIFKNIYRTYEISRLTDVVEVYV